MVLYQSVGQEEGWWLSVVAVGWLWSGLDLVEAVGYRLFVEEPEVWMVEQEVGCFGVVEAHWLVVEEVLVSAEVVVVK